MFALLGIPIGIQVMLVVYRLPLQSGLDRERRRIELQVLNQLA